MNVPPTRYTAPWYVNSRCPAHGGNAPLRVTDEECECSCSPGDANSSSSRPSTRPSHPTCVRVEDDFTSGGDASGLTGECGGSRVRHLSVARSSSCASPLVRPPCLAPPTTYILDPATTAPCWCLAAGGSCFEVASVEGPPGFRLGRAHRPGARSFKPAGRSLRTTPPLPRCRLSAALRGMCSSVRSSLSAVRGAGVFGVLARPSGVLPSRSSPSFLDGVRKPSSSRASSSSRRGCLHHPGTSSSSSLTYRRMASNASILPRFCHVSYLARSSADICHFDWTGQTPWRAWESSAYSSSLVSSLKRALCADTLAALTAA